jgi:hypothetical protein
MLRVTRNACAKARKRLAIDAIYDIADYTDYVDSVDWITADFSLTWGRSIYLL